MSPRRPHPCSHRRVAVAIACTAALLSGCFYNSQSAAKVQASYAQKLAPARVQQRTHKIFDEIRPLKVRFYADAEYRGATLEWKAKARILIRRVNEVIRPAFGVELQIESVQAWERSGGGHTLETMLQELEVTDPGDDVDFVVGLVNQLDSATTNLSHIGMARPWSKHMVLRGMNDIAERKLLDEVFDELDESDREKLYQARKRHKELTVFLHEWAHNLGAMHAHNTAAIMNVAYNEEVHEFAPPTVGIIEIALKYRGIGEVTPTMQTEMMKELAAFVDKSDRSFWDADDLELSLAAFDAFAKGMPQDDPNAGPTERASANLTPAARRSFYKALDQERAGRYGEAWKIVFPLTESYREDAQVQLVGCRLAARVKKTEWPAPETCNLAAQLAPLDPTPQLSMARAYGEAGDDEHALASLREAHEVLDGNEHAQQAYWLALASGYHERELFTWAAQALEHVTDNATADEMRKYALQTRRRYGLPSPGDAFGIAPEHEAEYLDAVKKALGLVYANEYAKANKLVEQGLEDYPKAPGFLVVECDMKMRMGKLAAAKKTCAKALERWDEAMWAHYLIGVIDARGKKHASAIEHLQRAIELDPDMKALWKLLGQVYERAGKKKDLDRLERLYRAQFNESL